MGCLFGGVAALLMLAIPASIARTSLVGAYVVIALLTALALAALLWRTRSRVADLERRARATPVRVGIAAVVYAAVATVIHFA